MLTQRDVSLKELNWLKRKCELMGASGKSTVNINKPIASEEDEMGLNPNKGRIDLSWKRSNGKVKFIVIKYHYWIYGERKWWITIICDEFKDRSEIRKINRDFSLVKINDDKVITENGGRSYC